MVTDVLQDDEDVIVFENVKCITYSLHVLDRNIILKHCKYCRNHCGQGRKFTAIHFAFCECSPNLAGWFTEHVTDKKKKQPPTTHNINVVIKFPLKSKVLASNT